MKYPFCKYVILIFCFLLGTANAADVIVKGVGANRTIALSEAFKEAVRQGIGTYIESNTIVQNDEIIKDNIIELAYGYVENYKVLSESQKGKTYHIRIQANVSNEAVSAVLSNILPANTLTEKDREKLNLQLDSEISAQINQHLRAKRKAAIDKVAGNICRKIFEEYRPAFSLIYEFIPDKIDVSSASETHVNLHITGIIRANPDLYNLILNSMIKKFERVMRKKLDWVSAEFSQKYYILPESKRNIYTKHTSLSSGFAVSFNSDALKVSGARSWEDNANCIVGKLQLWHLDNIPFLRDVKPVPTDIQLKIYLVDKKGDILSSVGSEVIRPLFYFKTNVFDVSYCNIFSPYFCLIRDRNYGIGSGMGKFLANWRKPYLEARMDFYNHLPIQTARKVAGVKGLLLNNNPAGEMVLNQLLKGIKK